MHISHETLRSTAHRTFRTVALRCSTFKRTALLRETHTH